MSDLADFLLARIAEDEALDSDICGASSQRVRRECEAKRRIAAEHDRLNGSVCSSCIEDYDYDSGLRDWPCATYRALAAVYADHPDYRDEWRA